MSIQTGSNTAIPADNDKLNDRSGAQASSTLIVNESHSVRSGNGIRMHDPSVPELPTLATANDIREVVQYLKQRPEGVNVCDVVQPLKKRIFFPPKIRAYLHWGLVIKNGERIKLSPAGWIFARSLEPEAGSYRVLLRGNLYYRTALEWVQTERMDLVTSDDMAQFWATRFPGLATQNHLAGKEGGVVSFFHICQAAELGSHTIGKRGQPARLRIWPDALAEFLRNHALVPGMPQDRICLLVAVPDQENLVDQIKNLLRPIGVQCQVLGIGTLT